MEYIWNLFLDFLLVYGVTGLILLAKVWLDGGQFHSWGELFGKWLSKMGRIRMGKTKWEQLEDAITESILTFAEGVKKGADCDDMEKNNVTSTSEDTNAE